MTEAESRFAFRTFDELRLADLEAVRLILRGESVIDWHRLNFESREQVKEFIRAHDFNPEDPDDRARIEQIKRDAIDYLRRNFEFPVPKPVAASDLIQLCMMASGQGHRQVCACIILKVMHIIHHLDARELLFMLSISNQDLCFLIEKKIYRVIGNMLARGFPIQEFIGGRKHKDSLYTKLLSKFEASAASIYDRLRFRIVTRSADDVLPVLSYLTQTVFPFNYLTAGQSTNTMFHFRSYCEKHPRLAALLYDLQLSHDIEDDLTRMENRFSASNYRAINFVVDIPVRLPPALLAQAPVEARNLGPVVFAQTEFQIVDQETEQENERGEASHAAYKERQKQAVMRRLKVGTEPRKRGSQRSRAK